MLTFIHSDRAVMRKVLGGHPGAFRVLVERYAGVVHGVAYARLRNTADAEDVAQETFVRFYQHLDQMAHRKHVGPWLVRVARNASIDLLRQRLREAGLLERQAPARPSLPNPMREELHQLLWEQIDGLGADAREVLVLHYFMKKKTREIAELLEISTDAAEKRVLRAREELGRRITDLLGAEIEDVKADAFRDDRIMAAVCAAPIAWKASVSGASAAATAAGVATGAGAAKLAAVVAAIVIVGVMGYLGYERYTRPYDAQDITAESTFTVEDTAAAEADKTAAAVGTQTPKAAESSEAAASSANAESAVPPVYAVVRGRAIFEDGSPAAGARVTLDNQEEVDQYERAAAAGYEGFEPVAPIRYNTTTDAAGKYELRDVYIGTGQNRFSRYRLYAEKGDLYSEVPNPSLTHLRREVNYDFILSPFGAIGGTVTDSQGKPVAGAFVATREQQAPRGEHRSATFWTKDDGAFLINHLLPGSCRLYVGATGHLETTTDFLAVGTTNNVIRLDTGNWISGRVVNRDTGESVANIQVFGKTENVSRGQGPGQQPVTLKYFRGETDSAGKFTITGCVPGTYTLGISPTKNSVLALTLVEPLSLKIGADPVTGLELKAAAGVAVRGRVIDDETGRAIVGQAFVNASVEDGVVARGGKVREDGAYELVGLSPGRLQMAVYCGQGSQTIPRYAGELVLNPGETEVTHDIHLPRRKAFAGAVVDETGAPVAGASVFAMSPGQPFEVGDAVSDNSGRFRMIVDRKDAPSTVYLQAMHETAYSPPSGPHRLSAPATDIVLKVSSCGRLEGEVVDRAGAPIGESVVCAVPEREDQLFLYRPTSHIACEINAGRSVNTLVQYDGGFSFSKLAAGRYTLHVYPFSAIAGTPLATADVTIQAGRTVRARLVVNTSGFGAIEGTVLLDGRPFAGQLIVVRPVSQKWVCHHLKYTDVDGHYEVPTLLPGEVEVTLDARSGSDRDFSKKQIAQVVSGEVTRIDFDIAAGRAAAEGTVFYEGSPAANVEVVFEPASSPGAGGPSARTNEQGFYRVEALPEGAYRAIATLTNYRAWPQTKLMQAVEAEVSADQSARIDFELVGGVIAGSVAGLEAGEKALVAVFPPDTVLEEWSVEALEALGERMLGSTMVEGNGPFSVTGMQEGDYIVGAATLPADGNVDAQALVEGRVAMGPVVRVVAGSVVEVSLVFENR